MKNTGFFLFGIIMFYISVSHAQQYGHEILELQNWDGNYLQSPQAFGFTAHGNQKISLFTGESGTTIPVYTYLDGDFSIPVVLEYNMPGFMPNQREGIVGLGWHLNAGGAITRIVNGRPDEAMGIIGGLDYKPHGLFYGIKNNYTVKSKSLQSIFDLTAGTVNTQWYWNVGDCEVTPDMFSFSMPGFSGRFYIQNNGEIRCVGNKPFKIDLSGFSTQYMDGGPKDNVNNSEIIITTDDGYKYYFGGDISKLEVLYSINWDHQACDPVIVSWYITKIIAPNGRQVEFKYRPFIKGIRIDEYPKDPEHYILNINHTIEQNADIYSFYPGSPLSAYNSGGGSSTETYYSVTKTIYLDSIIINNVKLKFSYLEKNHFFYTSSSYLNNNFNQKNLKLEKIHIINSDNSLIKEFTFSQQYLGDNNPRMFLKTFGETGINPYKFDYYGVTSLLPDPLTMGVDHWGFWNNYSSTEGSSIPTFVYYENGDVNITGSERSANTALCNKAMLQKITYPTQGTTTFYYEPHDYAKRLERRNDDEFKPKLYNVTGNTGGARICKIVDNDGSKDNVREYKYSNNYITGGNTSSGILMDWPRYAFYWKYNEGSGRTSSHLRVRSSSFNRNYNNGESYIQYSEVTELYLDNGCINYLFTDYVTNPDENNFGTKILDATIYPLINNVHLWNSYVGIKFNNKSFERGIPKTISSYKKDGSNFYIVNKKETTQFTGSSDFPNSYLVGVHQTGGIAQSYKKYYYPFLPKQTVEITYSENGTNPVTITTNYQYNNNGYLIYKDYSTSNGDVIKSKIRYPADINNSIYSSMIFLNMLNFPIEQTSLRNNYVIGGTLTTYKTGGGSYVPDKVYLVETISPLPSFSYFNGITKDISYASTAETEFISYNSEGKLLKSLTKNGLYNYYIWAYNKQYPIAKIETPLNTTISISVNDNNLSKSTILNSIKNDVIYLKGLLSTFLNDKNYQVTIYTYKPLVGITSQTNSSGITIYYQYDSLGRLEYIKDHDEKLSKKYSYNYAN